MKTKEVPSVFRGYASEYASALSRASQRLTSIAWTQAETYKPTSVLACSELRAEPLGMGSSQICFPTIPEVILSLLVRKEANTLPALCAARETAKTPKSFGPVGPALDPPKGLRILICLQLMVQALLQAPMLVQSVNPGEWLPGYVSRLGHQKSRKTPHPGPFRFDCPRDFASRAASGAWLAARDPSGSPKLRGGPCHGSGCRLSPDCGEARPVS